MDPELRDQLLAKELQYVEVYLGNLEATAWWRFASVASLAKDAGASLRKCSALISYTGEWWRDLWLYLASIVPVLIPINLTVGIALFSGLMATLSSALTTVEHQSVVSMKTIEVPFLWIFTKKVQVPETVMVSVPQPPDQALVVSLAITILIGGMLLSAVVLKRVWIYEIRYRRQRLERLWRKAR